MRFRDMLNWERFRDAIVSEAAGVDELLRVHETALYLTSVATRDTRAPPAHPAESESAFPPRRRKGRRPCSSKRALPLAAPAPGPIATAVGAAPLSETAAKFGVGAVYSGAELAAMGGARDPPAFELVSRSSCSQGSRVHPSPCAANGAYEDGDSDEGVAPSASDSESCLSDGPGGSFPHPEAVTAFFAGGTGGGATGPPASNAASSRARHPLSSGLPPEDVWAAVVAGRPLRRAAAPTPPPPSVPSQAVSSGARLNPGLPRAQTSAGARAPSAPLAGAAALRARMLAAVRSAYEAAAVPGVQGQRGRPPAARSSAGAGLQPAARLRPALRGRGHSGEADARDEDRAWAYGRSGASRGPEGRFSR